MCRVCKHTTCPPRLPASQDPFLFSHNRFCSLKMLLKGQMTPRSSSHKSGQDALPPVSVNMVPSWLVRQKAEGETRAVFWMYLTVVNSGEASRRLLIAMLTLLAVATRLTQSLFYCYKRPSPTNTAFFCCQSNHIYQDVCCRQEIVFYFYCRSPCKLYSMEHLMAFAHLR